MIEGSEPLICYVFLICRIEVFFLYVASFSFFLGDGAFSYRWENLGFLFLPRSKGFFSYVAFLSLSKGVCVSLYRQTSLSFYIRLSLERLVPFSFSIRLSLSLGVLFLPGLVRALGLPFFSFRIRF